MHQKQFVQCHIAKWAEWGSDPKQFSLVNPARPLLLAFPRPCSLGQGQSTTTATYSYVVSKRKQESFT